MKQEDIYQTILSVLTDEATDEEREAFSLWLAESEEHRTEYEKIHKLYLRSLSKKKENTYDTEKGWQHVYNKTIRKKKVRFTRIWLRYAAAIVIFITVGVYFYIDKPEEPLLVNITEYNEPTLVLDNGKQISLQQKPFSLQEKNVVIKNDSENKLVYEESESDTNEPVTNNHLVIPRGKTYQLVLSDGTKIWLNAETELTYPSRFNQDKREVTLKGEAFFEVTKDTQRPFYVKTKGMDVKVLGTSFNVSCYANDQTIQTTLVEGSVRVVAGNGEERVITPSEQLSYNKEKQNMQVQTVNTDLYTSWINGEYIFKNASLETIIHKLQRWHDFSVNYENDQLKNCRFSLTIDRNLSVNQLIEVINYTSNVELELVNNRINIKERRRDK